MDSAFAPQKGFEPSEELAHVVRLNEGIKQVVMLAFRINLMALNAILLARRAGEAARGFVVVSKELRELSVALTGLMHDVGNQAARSVYLISESLRRQRRQRLLQDAQGKMAVALPSLSDVIDDHVFTLEQNRKHMIELRDQLRRELETSLRKCRFGIAISRAARIEAVYGAQLSRQLAEVSAEFDESLQNILPALNALCDELKESI